MSKPVTTRSTVIVWLALLALALSSYGLSFLQLRTVGVPIALGIGAVKAVLVAGWFMHLVESKTASRWAFAVGLALAGVLLIMVSLDVLTRGPDALRPPG